MSELSDRVSRLHREAPLSDVHAHPSLKVYLFGRNLWRHYGASRAFNPFSSRSDFTMLEASGVRVLWAAHYLPERNLFRDCWALRVPPLSWLPVRRKLTEGSLLHRLLQMMDALEREIARRADRTELARSAADVERIAAEGKIAVVHTVEGAHVLEGDPDNLEVLAGRGVAMLTLAHFYANGLVAQVNGVPKGMIPRFLCGFRFDGFGEPPLTELGRAVIRKMKGLPMIVDVTHCTPEARAAVFGEVNRERPVVASHVGVSALNPDPYNLRPEEVREIAASGGAVGLILMTYWLDHTHPKNGLDPIWRTLEEVQRITGSWDHVMIGSDFDGFTDPPDDVRHAGELGRITAMLIERGLDDDSIRKILGGNALRVLRKGWR